MPELVPSIHNLGYDIPRAIQAALAIIGSIVGAYLCTMGVYLTSANTPGFAYYDVPFLAIVIGLQTVYASKLAMTGILQDNASYIRLLAVLIWLIIIGEAWLVVVTSIGKLSIEEDFRFAWSQIYNDNRWRLGWIESRFGCCGFKSAADMPSSDKCAKEPGRVNGCVGPLRRHVAHLDALALEWTLVTILIQAALVAVGWIVYRQARNGGVWLVEELENGELAAEEGPRGGANTPAVGVTFSPSTAGNDDSFVSTDEPQQQARTSG
ncbi:hypothetical protein GGI20_006196 [Coemansia sp. BCRC 34301]|nr:hypothetical protein GGI20_006196 [Coemansia sp. BCRC 34301]